ncbi:MAG TPA: Flp pilus assembly protein CpaB [Frankiaceae bacterium]|nr:Flp pilus assembly protein CpaB [Frankiaceae bacterium]
MKSRNNLMIVVGVVLAVLGAAFAALYVRGNEAAAVDTRAVVVVAKAVRAGTPAADAAFEVRRMPATGVPADALQSTATLNGQVALHAISANQVVTQSMFGVRGTAASGGVVLPKGMKGIGVELAFAPGGLRYVVPGDRIDVFASEKRGDAVTTQVLLRGVQVIATTPGAGTGEATPTQAGPGALHFLLAVDEAQAVKIVNARHAEHAMYFALAATGKGVQ